MLLALAVACQSDGAPRPPDGLPHAAAVRSCGPADGPAVAIYLAPTPVTAVDPATPYVRLTVFQPLGQLEGGSWRIAAGDDAAAGWYFRALDDFEAATGGRVTVTEVRSDTTVRGTMDVTFPTAGRVTGAFEAAWISASPLCG